MVEGPYPRTAPCIRPGSRPAAGRLRACLVAGLLLATPQLAAAQVLSGSYTGDGNDNRSITELNFTPDVVIVKSDATQVAVIRTSTMSGDLAKPMTGATALTANLIQSLDNRGFTLGTDVRVNGNGTEYYWIAFKANPGKMKVGSYVGTGGTPRTVTGVGFSAEAVFVMSAVGNKAVGALSTGVGGMDFDFGTVNGALAWFTAGTSDGFTVTNAAEVNTLNTTYHYVAWNEVAGQMDSGQFAGNGADDRNITGVGFKPEYVFVRSSAAQNGVHKTASMETADDTLFFDGQASVANRVQALQSDGFQVGNDVDVNQSTTTIYYLAWGRTLSEPQVVSGSYSGDGVDGKAISGVGFAPDLVIVKSTASVSPQTGVFRTSLMIGDLSKPATGLTGAGANYIQTLTEGGFTVGTDARVNSNTVTYQWIAFAAGAGEMVVGTYTGTGVDSRNITGVGFQPEYVMVMSAGANEAVHRSSTMSGDISFEFDNTGSGTDLIQALQADGFQVGLDARVNTSGVVYYYVAWNEIAGKMDVGSYSGNATDDRSITGIGFLPQYVIVRPGSANSTVHHSAAMGASTDDSARFWATGNLTDSIQALEANGFQVGLNATVNTSGTTYHYMAWSQATLTAVRMAGARAARTEKGVTVTWRTGYEVDNVGFEVYREVAGERTRVTATPIAGSALFVPQGFGTVGRPYTWNDEAPQALEKDVAYWIEDIDLNGTRTLHGPIFPQSKKAWGDDDKPAAARGTVPPAGETPSLRIQPSEPNSPLLEELKTVERPAEQPSVTPISEEPRSSALTTTPTGPIYLGVPVSAAPRSPAAGPAPAAPPAAPRSTVPSAPSTRSASASPESRTSQARAPSTSLSAQSSAVQTQPVPGGKPENIPAASASPVPPQSTPVPSASSGAPSAPTGAPVVASQPAQPVLPARLRLRPRPLNESMSGAAGPGPSAELLQQWTIASQPGTRVDVRDAGWYRFTRAALTAAGINPAVDPRNLRLVVDGVERPMLVTGQADGTFDVADVVEFYATGVDTPFTDARSYWITAGSSAGLRLPLVDARQPGTPAGASFAHTVDRKDRAVFFAALQNGDDENFFGPLIMEGSPTHQDVTLPHVAASGTTAHLTVVLQGVTALAAPDDHRVGVFVNGTEVGEIVFDGLAAAATSFPVAHAVLTTGVNTVSLEARGGVDDMTLVDYVRLTYQREYRADANQLTLNADAGQQLTVTDFTNASIRVFDVTGDGASSELVGTVAADGGGWAITLTVPAGGTRRLFMTTSDAIGTPATVQANAPSTLNLAGQAGDVVMITDAAFTSALAPLRTLRQSQGYAVQIVNVQDIYDEFAFGQKTPEAIRAFLVRAAATWAKPPRFVLLVGNATNDPRNYLGFNEPDFVPTRIVPTDVLETASDDWFVDADGDSFAELAAIGRLPARSAAEATTMVDKIVAYEQASPEAWHSSVLLVSDQGDTEVDEFSTLNDIAGALVPAGYQVNHLKRAEDPTPAATFRTRLSEGAVLVNYQGHGSVDVWRGDVLTAADVPTLDNGSRLPLVVAMTCFAGFFHGLFPEESLAEALLRAPGGGAVGVWASSGMTDARWQASMDRELFRQMFRGGWTSVGEAVRAAKKVVGNQDIRRTWILFGDPALRLKGLSRAPVPSSTTVTPMWAPPDLPDDEPAVEELADGVRRAPHLAVRLGDFDGDARDDALLAEPATGAWLSALGGPGTFRYTAGTFNVVGEPIALKLNDDSRTDLFVYNPTTGEWLQAMSAGDGRFITSTGAWMTGLEVVAGDWDGDGHDDLFGHHPDGRWIRAFSNGDGEYQYRYGRGLQPGHAYVADFNADARADVFIYDPSNGRWTISYGTIESPRFMTAGQWPAGWQPVVARLNDDQAADILLWHAESGEWVECLYDSEQVFIYRVGRFAPGGRVHAFDMNGDGRDELLRYDWRTGDWTLAALNTSGQMQQWDGLWESGWELTPGDLNADGRLDLLLYNPDTGEWIRRLNLVSGWTDDASGLWSRNWTVAGRRR